MKKLRVLLGAILAAHASLSFADIIKVSNNAPYDIYVAVYEEFSGKAPKLYGKVITITPHEIAAVERPKWIFSRLGKNNNRNLYFDSGAQGKSRLASGNPAYLSKNYVNIGERKGDAFAIYPVMDDGETPSFMGQALKGTTQEDFDKNIKSQIH